MFSALMHDINHSGKTNTFETNTFSEYSFNYNDISVNLLCNRFLIYIGS